jgi:uncharacterized protein involved in response to NO
MTSRTSYAGPALFSYGFRPFFLAASVFALGVMPAWLLVGQGSMEIGGPFHPIDWHVHEMLFGYTAAVVAGFLFTAIPNWTGRLPVCGWPLVILATLWALGRIAVAGGFDMMPVAVMLLDCGFLGLVTLAIAREIVAGRNWRNLLVVIPVSLLTLANILFHLEAMQTGSSGAGRRLGFAVVVFLLMLMGGRIIPSFTRNWLVQRGSRQFPVPFGRYDGLCLVAGAVALLAWTIRPDSRLTALVLVAAGILHFTRLVRWRGHATWPSPLLLMLHAAYAFVPMGLVALGSGAPSAVGLHLLGIGAVGGMSVAVMIRATRGHTGRSLVAGPALTTAFGLVVLSALVRAFFPAAGLAGLDGIAIAGVLWTLGFGIVAVRLGPWLAAPAAQKRTPSRVPA